MTGQVRLYKGLTVDDLRAVLRYEQATGQLFWLVTLSNRALVGTRAGKLARNGYRMVGVRAKQLQEHIVCWALAHGEFPDTKIDHEDLDKANNRLANLRPCTTQENSANRGVFANSTTGVKGVTWLKAKQRYRAFIKVNGRQIHLGLFDTIEAAASAYSAAATEHFGAFARSA